MTDVNDYFIIGAGTIIATVGMAMAAYVLNEFYAVGNDNGLFFPEVTTIVDVIGMLIHLVIIGFVLFCGFIVLSVITGWIIHGTTHAIAEWVGGDDQ